MKKRVYFIVIAALFALSICLSVAASGIQCSFCTNQAAYELEHEGVMYYFCESCYAIAAGEEPEPNNPPNNPRRDNRDDRDDGPLLPASSTKDDNNTLIYILIAVGVVALGGGAYALSRKNSGNTTTPPMNMNIPQYQPQDTYTPPINATVPVMNSPPPSAPVVSAELKGIKGTAGEYGGSNFNVRVSITLGRDSSRCQVVFQPKSEGVSGLHCEIRRYGSGLQIVDLASSNGTFVNGAKIPANIPVDLKSGDNFCLGSQRNSFTVF